MKKRHKFFVEVCGFSLSILWCDPQKMIIFWPKKKILNWSSFYQIYFLLWKYWGMKGIKSPLDRKPSFFMRIFWSRLKLIDQEPFLHQNILSNVCHKSRFWFSLQNCWAIILSFSYGWSNDWTYAIHIISVNEMHTEPFFPQFRFSMLW